MLAVREAVRKLLDLTGIQLIVGLIIGSVVAYVLGTPSPFDWDTVKWLLLPVLGATFVSVLVTPVIMLWLVVQVCRSADHKLWAEMQHDPLSFIFLSFVIITSWLIIPAFVLVHKRVKRVGLRIGLFAVLFFTSSQCMLFVLGDG